MDDFFRDPRESYRSAGHSRIRLSSFISMCNDMIAPYRLDALTGAMLAATALDAWTTYYFLSHGLGVEMNPVLAPLVQQSLVWVPVYLLTPTLLVPAMPEVCRQSFAVFYLAIGLLFSINNLGGIYAGSFALVDSVGFQAIRGFGLFLGALAFIGLLDFANAAKPSALRCTAIALVWIPVFGAIEGLFYVASRFL